MARGKHLFPFRTERLSPSAPMVLGPQGPGRVGRRRLFVGTGRLRAARSALWKLRGGWSARSPADCALAGAAPRRASTPSSELDGFCGGPRGGRSLRRDIPEDPVGTARVRAPLRGRAGFIARHRARERRLLGWFQAEEAADAPGEVELGYRLRPDAWGQGYASEGAAALLARRASRGRGCARVYAHALLSNPGSIRVMEKIGMTYARPWAYRGFPVRSTRRSGDPATATDAR